MFVSVLPSEDGGEIDKPTFLEATCKLQLHHTSSHQDIDLSKREVEGTIEYQYSLSIPRCVPKDCRKHRLINGTGYSGAILSDSHTFLSYVKYMLCYHAWCHDSHLLPVERGTLTASSTEPTILVIQTPVKFTYNCTTARVNATLVT